MLKFVYFEKATKFCEISTLLLSTVHTDKSNVDILQSFVAFSEYMNFTRLFIILVSLKVSLLREKNAYQKFLAVRSGGVLADAVQPFE